ncbi:nucleotidyl transferase AbiEii/AbiGii toxin family protein [Pectobacterium polaris]|uniref:nucleotidyl transferase AbiEii/AbiGii toxin family protein n=1 Tax=Pectobacterium polaris TaxID=2042057 RepID=UPI001CC7D116|nr:nucleotidyl transferase AbiEii/AbiGii toxin family protein [Pectobacterium polaris]UAY90581.1 nucleotidyl transferase AbiEii/AbiGii toxin family protein [Pectobacterium polaris]
MAEYKISHHKIIRAVLDNFNTDFFIANSIFFGGGTRIALEINEYRESIDVDFLCPNKDSYRAVREQVTSGSLGLLVKKEFNYAREITFDRYAVRTFIDEQGKKVKLEIVSFDNYQLIADDRNIFPVPCIDRETCFYTKLLANADRCLVGQCKDVFDIIAMYDAWGNIPERALSKAEEHYGSTVLKTLIRALQHMQSNKEKYHQIAASLLIQEDYAKRLIEKSAEELLTVLSSR